MSDQTDHIQSMISKIDRVLDQTRSRQFWTIFSRYALQRQLIERCRNFLVMQHRSQSVDSVTTSLPKSGKSNQAITSELQRLRQELIHPLRSDVVLLGNHRAALQEEIQALMLQKAQLQSECNTYRQTLALGSTDYPQQTIRSSAMDETELARLQSIRDRTNFLLTSLDSSLQLAFGSMQKNVEVYQATLNTGLDRMHHLGYQGEVLFSTLVNRLAQQVGRELMAATTDDRSRSSLTPDSSSQTIDGQTIDGQTSDGQTPDSQPEKLVSRRSVQPLAISQQPVQQPIQQPIAKASHEAIDAFFADFKAAESQVFDENSNPDRSWPPAPPAKSLTPSDSLPSFKTRPQKIDAAEVNAKEIDATIDLPHAPDPDPSPLSQNESNGTESVTLDTLFQFPKEILLETSSSDITLTEIDQLFADMPSF